MNNNKNIDELISDKLILLSDRRPLDHNYGGILQCTIMSNIQSYSTEDLVCTDNKLRSISVENGVAIIVNQNIE